MMIHCDIKTRSSQDLTLRMFNLEKEINIHCTYVCTLVVKNKLN